MNRPQPPFYAQSALPDAPTAYGAPFWLAYVGNTLTLVAVSLLYRYADFVVYLGGTEWHLGWIVGVGMVGSLAVRAALGVGIDHYGPRAVWLAALALFSASCLAHLAVGSCHGPVIYLLRIAWCCSVAGIFGAAMTFVSRRAPEQRMAEMIGMLGTSGFVGMVLGTQLGDLLLGTRTIEWRQIQLMFVAAALATAIAMIFVYLATRGEVRLPRIERPPLIDLLRRHLPPAVLMVGIAMGVGLSLPTTFLRTYAAELDIPRMGLFFSVYAPTALITRLLTRRLPERFGTTPMILVGLAALAVSQGLFLLVRVEWQLIIPGVTYGFAHAVLFPSVVAAGSRAFPQQHRGLGTTLMLGTWDAGQLIGAPAAGAILHCSGWFQLPPYPTLFVTMAGLLATVGLAFAWLRRPGRLPHRAADRPREDRVGEATHEPALVPESPVGDG